MKAPAAMPMATEAAPTIAKDTRQPCSPRTVRRPMFVPSRVPAMTPTFMANCMHPKTLPRQLSEVTSAMTPLAMGLREASIAPLNPRRMTIGNSWSTAARIMVIRPCTTQPMAISHFLFMRPRSATTPQKGAAKLWQSAWTRVMRARSLRDSPKLSCNERNTHGSRAMSAPSNVPTEQSMQRSLQSGNLSCSISWPGFSATPDSASGFSSAHSGFSPAPSSTMPSGVSSCTRACTSDSPRRSIAG
mmetsp:Transcript_34323/g.94838  ORF Transcript_34323/g.94838 Transcript_34323/m.94838 type:complete len:245 (+) Transcript_34323:939-1673(+)